MNLLPTFLPKFVYQCLAERPHTSDCLDAPHLFFHVSVFAPIENNTKLEDLLMPSTISCFPVTPDPLQWHTCCSSCVSSIMSSGSIQMGLNNHKHTITSVNEASTVNTAPHLLLSTVVNSQYLQEQLSHHNPRNNSKILPQLWKKSKMLLVERL